uniref:Uncharacterized protein n=1 Tax=Oryza glumipatula TaxID=40148 RepID=A0A0E0AW02_9ORYZ
MQDQLDGINKGEPPCFGHEVDIKFVGAIGRETSPCRRHTWGIRKNEWLRRKLTESGARPKIVTGGIWSRGPIPLGRRPKLTVRFHVFSARGFVARHVSPSKFWKPPERATLIPSSLLVSSSSALPDCHLPRFPSLAVASTQIRKTLGQRTGIRNTARNSGARATRSTSMEKKELLGVRKSPPLTKRRRKVTAGGAGGGSMAKAIAAYLASDSFMYAPLVSNSPPPPPSSPPAGAGSSDKMVALVQKYRGSWRGALAFNIEESEHQRRQRLAAWRARCATSDCHLYSCCDQEMLMINRVQANAEHMLLQPEPCLRAQSKPPLGDRAIGAQLRQLAAARAAGRRQVEAAGAMRHCGSSRAGKPGGGDRL